MKGNSITAIVDCKKQQNREIARVPEDTIATDGIVLLGQEIEDNTFFPGSLNFISFFKLVVGGYRTQVRSYLSICEPY